MENHNPKISVIVPVYNVEKYLRRCVDSILAQTFTDFELLLIDDGSKDKSGEICDEYAKTDNRVKVFHKENGGVSSARNLGLDNAKGEYLFFFDGDDWLDPIYLTDLYFAAIEHNTDIVACDYFVDLTNSESNYIKQKYNSNNISCIKNFLNNNIGGYLWNKIIRKSVFTNNDIKFSKDIAIWEDLLVIIKLYTCTEKIYYVPKAYYHYIKYNSSSATYNFSEIQINQKIKVCAEIESLLNSKNLLNKCTYDLNIRQLIAKMEFATDSNFYNFEKWNCIFPNAINGLNGLKYPKWIKLQIWLVYNKMYFFAHTILFLKKIIKS